MLWGTGECQEGKVWGCTWGVYLMGLEGLWTQVLSIWTIYGHTAVHLVLSYPEQGVIHAPIRTTPSTDTRGKAKLQAWPGTGSKLAKTPEKQPVPVGARVILRRMVVPEVHEGIQQSTAVALAWADKLLQTLYEHLCMLWALAQRWLAGPLPG